MAVKFSEMIALRIDLALDLEAGFDNYLEDIAGGYGDFLTPVVCEGDPEFDPRHQLVLLRRSVERQRHHLESLDEGTVGQFYDDDKIRAEVNKSRIAFDGKLRLVRSGCRGFFGLESLDRIGIKGIFPTGPARLYRFGLMIKAGLEDADLGLVPLLDLDLDDDEGKGMAARLASQLDPELSDLGRMVGIRHQERRRTVGVRLKRQAVTREFDETIRGIVRMAQGMCRLAGRTDLGERFRPILRRTLRKLEGEEGTEAQPAESESTDAEGAETTGEEVAEETS